MKRRIEEVLNQLRPELQAHGGDVELVEVTEDKVVKVRLTGACAGCPMSALTLAMGVERALRREIPEIKGVVAVP
ncbi:MAG: NifU family protein [Hadesarchaea archaeon]|nr:MAG: NifU family protein [Hadesarchaea archaeon]